MTWLAYLLRLLTPTGRDTAQRFRRLQADAELAAQRIKLACLLARIGNQEIAIAELEQRDAAAQQPAIAAATQRVLVQLGDLVQGQVSRFEVLQKGLL